jgi:hypothetical protein
MNTRARAGAERREEQRTAREKVHGLRRQLREARVRRKQALFDAKERCRAERLALRERSRTLRLRTLEELAAAVRSDRVAAREACAERLVEARAIRADVGRARATLAAERQLQRDLRHAERAARERRRRVLPSACAGSCVDAEEDVAASLPSDLAALYERVKNVIKPTPGRSRPEAFLKWAETHPEEVLVATGHPAQVAVRDLEEQVGSATHSLNPYHAKRAARIERMKRRSENLEAAAEGAHRAAHTIADRIPVGQPILSGHHSEQRHRRDLGRIHRGFDKAAKLRREAVALQGRAEHAEASRAVSSDDPDAIELLRAKFETLERDRARMVAANKAVRSKDPEAGLRKLGFSEGLIARVMAPDVGGRVGFPAYALSNLASDVARVRKRITELEARATRPVPPPVDVPGARIDEADNRVHIFFDTKPAETVRSALKGAGFRWSPKVGSWQRHASNAAWHEAKRIVGVPETAGRPPSREDLANQNGPTRGRPRPEEVERIRALDQRPHVAVKGHDLDTTQVAARIREDIKAAVRAGDLPKAHYSVRTDKYSMGSSITVVAAKLPFEVLNPDAFFVERGANWLTFDRARHRSRFSAEAQGVERTLNKIVDAYHWDRSDSMTDSYNERFAKHVEVKEDEGAWNKLERAKVTAAREAEERG